MTQVTPNQNEYLLRLEEKPMTTRDLMLDRMVTIAAAGRIIKKLKEAGLVESTRKFGERGNILIHKLVKPYSKLMIDVKISKRNTKVLITDEEILYAAILRNAGMTGQRLSDQYLKVFPKRGKGAIKNIVGKARNAELCR
jgi:DNA-binding MarR family transcriptional regulator